MIIRADARSMPLAANSVQCVVTSPPYWGLRDYGTARWEGGDEGCEHASRLIREKGEAKASTLGGGKDHIWAQEMATAQYRDACRLCGARRIDAQIGLEASPEAFVATMVEVFREVRRVLKDDGTLWLNLGDSYAGSGKGQNGNGEHSTNPIYKQSTNNGSISGGLPTNYGGLKPKDLCGIPWSVAKALQAPYYTGRISAERDRVWLAAMIDAEGTICGFEHERKDNGQTRHGIHVTITNSNLALLNEAFRIWPTTREDHNPHSAGHLGDLPTWRWIVHRMENKSALLAELYPYFIAKKKQALLAWNFVQISTSTRGRNKGYEGDQNRERYAWIVRALSKLNHLESVDIPNWVKEPPSMLEPGWYLRSDIVWAKGNPMPESVTDRPTRSHEYLFLLSKNERYFYDADAIREPAQNRGEADESKLSRQRRDLARTGNITRFTRGGGSETGFGSFIGRNRRDVWTINSEACAEAHFATFPQKLVEPCILAGSRPGDIVFDPFLGSGTVGKVAERLGRRWAGLELSAQYIQIAKKRTAQMGLF